MTDLDRQTHIEEILNVIQQFASGHFSNRAPSYNKEDSLDAIATGINMLEEEVDSRITELKQAEEAMRKNEEYLEKLFLFAPDAYYLSDIKGNFVDGNLAAEQLLGYKKEELIGKNFLKLRLLSAKQILKAAALLAKNVLGIPTGPDEFEIKRKDGSLVTVEIRTDLIKVKGKTLVLGIARDLTERKSAEEVIKASEYKFRKIWESSYDGMRLTNADGKILMVNDAYCQLVRLERKNLEGQVFTEVYDKSIHADLIEIYKDHFKSGKFVPHFETKKKMWDGRIEWLEVSSSFFVLDEVQTELCIFRNITRYKQAEEALKDSEERFRDFFMNAAVGFHIFGPDRIITDMNNTELALFGYDRDEIIGKKKWSDLIISEQIPLFEKHWKELLTIHEVRDLEYTVLHKDGHPIEVILNASARFDKVGNLINTRGNIIDITEKKKAETELIESEKRFGILSEAAFEGIAITNKGKVIDVSDQLAEMLGYNRSELIGIDAVKFVAPESRELVHKNILARVEGPYEHKALKKDGTIMDVEVHGKTIPYAGKTMRVTAIRDITERKQLEEQLRHAQKLESITKLTGGIAHDFNNILGYIFGSVDMILMNVPEDHPARRFAHIILDKSQEAADLVKQMLAYSRQQHLKVEPLILNKAIEDLSMLLGRALEERIKLKLILSDDLKAINGDKTAIDQILMNLCLNATDAMKDGGKLTVRTENLEHVDKYVKKYPNLKPGEYVLLSVTDTGHGIESENLEHIFEPFFTTKDVGEGTGLGLSMVFGLVKQHEGYIFCKSEVGKGTTFEVLLPVIDKLQAPTEKENTNGHLYRGGGTIMVVEDEKDLVEIIEVMLTELDYDIITASNGKKALLLYRDAGKQIDLVISDIIMPKMGGKELYKELVKINPEVKFVFSSGYASRGFFKKYDIDPDMKILNKPFRLKDVSDMVKEVLNQD